MHIFVAYKDPPELSMFKRSLKTLEDEASDEKELLVNPNCPVRIMLEYIRKTCKLAPTTIFDLCEENGVLKGLFNFPTYSYATMLFDHKKTYYLIVIKYETEKTVSVFPQLNHDNKLYNDLQTKVKRFLLVGDASPTQSQSVKGGTKKK